MRCSRSRDPHLGKAFLLMCGLFVQGRARKKVCACVWETRGQTHKLRNPFPGIVTHCCDNHTNVLRRIEPWWLHLSVSLTWGLSFWCRGLGETHWKQNLASSSPSGMKGDYSSWVLIEALGKPSSSLSSLGGKQWDVKVKLQAAELKVGSPEVLNAAPHH